MAPRDFSGTPAAAFANQVPTQASVSFVCEPGRLEAQAVLLAASLRQAHPGLPLIAATPRSVSPLAAHAFEALGVSRVAIANPVAPDYPIGNKVAALGADEPRGLRLFLDSDMLCLRGFDWTALLSHPLALKPADMGSFFGNDNLWQRLYARCGLSLPSERVVATVGREMMYPYFNAGMIATTEASALAPLWAQLCRDVDRMDDINPRRPWLDQIALPLAAAKLGLPTRSLGEYWNYPAHIKPLQDHPALVHYHYPSVVMREPALLDLVWQLLSRHPRVRAVVEADADWQALFAPRRTIEEGTHRPRHRWTLSSLRGGMRARAGSDAPVPGTSRDLIVTGIPRSGTSYVCSSLDKFENVAAINEPALLFEGLRYGPEPWTVPVLHADLRARIDLGETVVNKTNESGGLTEDTAIHDRQGNYRPHLLDAHWVLATKNTLAYMARLEGILRVMPHARVVACIRHPLDTLASWKGTFAHLANGDPSGLPVGGLLDPFLPAQLRSGMDELVRLEDPAMRRAAWWRLLAQELLRWRHRIEIVRYEDLVTDPHAQLQRLLGPLKRAAGRAGAIAPSSPRIARRETLNDADWRAVASLCADVASEFGYDCERPPGVAGLNN